MLNRFFYSLDTRNSIKNQSISIILSNNYFLVNFLGL